MTIHTALVAKQSSALKSLVSGSMEEAQTKTAIWEDVDEETFGLYAQFVYTGDYTPPSHVIEYVRVPRSRSASPPAATAEPTEPEIAFDLDDFDAKPPDSPLEEELDIEVDVYRRSRYVSKKKKGKQAAYLECKPVALEVIEVPKPSRIRFHDLSYSILDLSLPTSPRANARPFQNFTPVFLGHARLYVFAEKYDIPALQTLALYKLHRTLCIFTLYAARYGDIVELARYVYANTPSRPVMDPLREMLVQYIAYEATSVARCAQCRELVEENGSFASDLLRMVLERVA